MRRLSAFKASELSQKHGRDKYFLEISSKIEKKTLAKWRHCGIIDALLSKWEHEYGF